MGVAERRKSRGGGGERAERQRGGREAGGGRCVLPFLSSSFFHPRSESRRTGPPNLSHASNSPTSIQGFSSESCIGRGKAGAPNSLRTIREYLDYTVANPVMQHEKEGKGFSSVTACNPGHRMASGSLLETPSTPLYVPPSSLPPFGCLLECMQRA